MQKKIKPFKLNSDHLIEIPQPKKELGYCQKIKFYTEVLRRFLCLCNFKIDGALKDDNGYHFIFRTRFPKLFRLAKLAGFFNFHITNVKEEIFNVHQLVAYAWKGYKKLLKGQVCEKGKLEVHHWDSNPDNNHPSNLTYTTPQMNVLAAIATKTKYYGVVEVNACPEFNDQGEKIVNQKAYTAYVLEKTIKATHGILRKEPDPVKYQNNWLNAIATSGRKLFDQLSEPILDFINPFSSIIDRINDCLKSTQEQKLQQENDKWAEYYIALGINPPKIEDQVEDYPFSYA